MTGGLALFQAAAVEVTRTQRVIQFAALLLELGGAVMIAVLFALARRSSRQRDYFETWTVAWYVMALALAGLTARYFLITDSSPDPLPEGDAVVRALYWVYEAGKFAYWVLIWRGAVEFAGTAPRGANRWRWLVAAAGASTLAFMVARGLNEMVVWQAPVAVACCVAAARTVARTNMRAHTLGRRTMAVVLAATATIWSLYFVVFVDFTDLLPLPVSWLAGPLLAYNTYIDMLLLVLLGYAMLMVYMEDARERMTDIEARLASLVQNASNPIFTIDANQRVVASNEAAARLFGSGSRVEHGAAVEDLVAPEHRAELRAAIEAFAGAGEPSRQVGGNEGLGAIRADGTHFTGEYTLSRLFDTDVTAVSLVVRDVSTQRELERRQRQASTMEAVRQLAGGLAHDFNNLLTTIVGRSQIVARSLAPASPVREDALQIERAAAEAARLARELLALSRREPLDPTRIPIDEFIRTTEASLRRNLAPNIELDVRAGAPDVHAHLDRRRLGATLQALVQNAQEAMPGGGTVTVETSHALLPRHLGANLEAACIGVRDAGAGFDAVARAHLFEPFFSTKGDGRGLGLATAWAFAHQSGGTVDVESGSRGTVVRLLFPVAATAAGAGGATMPPGQQAGSPEVPALAIVPDTPHTRRAVLLAEDEASVRKSVRIFLERAGFDVVEAADGVEALAAFDRAPDEIGMLLTDVMMPQMGGRELATRLMERRPSLPVVFMSGFLRDPEVLRMVNDRRVRFLAKPFDVDDLVAIVRAELGATGTNAA